MLKAFEEHWRTVEQYWRAQAAKTKPICAGALHFDLLKRHWRSLNQHEFRTFGVSCENPDCQNGHAKFGIGGFLCDTCRAELRAKLDAPLDAKPAETGILSRLMHEPEEEA